MRLEFKPTGLLPIVIKTNEKDVGLMQEDGDIVVLRIIDLPRFIHELQIIANQQKAVGL